MRKPQTPYAMPVESKNGGRGPPPTMYNPNYKKNKPPGAKRKRRSTCFRCICFCYCCLFLIILILSILALYFFTIYKPQVPSYNVENLEVKAFDMQPDFSLKTEFLVTVKSANPNSNIGFMYGENSSVDVIYADSNICSGKLPHFLQPHNNVTLMKIDLVGRSEFGSGLQEAYNDNRNNKKIPLLVKVKVPVRIVVGEFPLREFMVFVNCSLVVDNLAPNKKINIISSTTTFDFKF